MHLFLTSVLPFLAHDHASAVAFLTCRHHNFHASIIPEFLSDEERVESFCYARQQKQLEPDTSKQFQNLYNLFVKTPLMQFSPSLVLRMETWESILKPLLDTKYFTRTLQQCSFLQDRYQRLSVDLVQGLSKVRSLTKLDLGWSAVENEHMEIIINSFLSLETLILGRAQVLKVVDPSVPAIKVSSPPPPATRTLRNLKLGGVDALLVAQFIPHFPNLRKLFLSGPTGSFDQLDLCRLVSSSLSLLTDLTLQYFTVENTLSVKNLVRLSSLQFYLCKIPDFSFLTEQNSLPDLTTLRIDDCRVLSTAPFASLSHAPNLQVLTLNWANFDNDCLQYLENMIHLRKLDLSRTSIFGDNRSLKTLMQNLFQLEELNLYGCRNIGNQGAIAGALYITHSRLRVLNLRMCNLDDDDLNGIRMLKNTLEVLDLYLNLELTNEALVYCKDLGKLKRLKLSHCVGINDVAPLKDCVNLEELDVQGCEGLTDNSFKVFSEEPNSFPKLSVLNLSCCEGLTVAVFEHLSKNSNLVNQLKELQVDEIDHISTCKSIYHLTMLQRLFGVVEEERMELLRNLKNCDEAY